MADLIANMTGRKRCPWCGDDGMVVVDSGTPDELVREWFDTVKAKTEKVVDGRTVVDMKARQRLLMALPIYGDQMGPCPRCEKGNVLEFPPGDRSGPWGTQGYWRGRTPELTKRDDTPAPPPPEVKEWLARVTAGVKSP